MNSLLATLGLRSPKPHFISVEMNSAGPGADPWAFPDHRGRRVQRNELPDVVRHDSNRICLFGNRACPFAHRAWLALHEVNAAGAVEYLHIDLGVHKPAFYQAELNPYGTTPALWDCGRLVPDSMVVVEYLAAKYAPEAGLFGSTAEEKAMIRIILAKFEPAAFYVLCKCRDPTAIRSAKQKVDSLVAAMENFYASSNGPYVLGDRLSAAEIAIAPFLLRMIPALRYYKGYEVLTPKAHPRLSAMLESIQKRPSMKATTCDPDFFVDSLWKYAEGPDADPVPGVVSLTKSNPLTAVSLASVAGFAAGALVLRNRK
mmetsp:Transcript_10660/g.40119  ORF Transcript_10660/g.40119 Transcript_10660/m.40119 type:complete len:315 (-) Transcript_10660:1712-2656(-)